MHAGYERKHSRRDGVHPSRQLRYVIVLTERVAMAFVVTGNYLRYVLVLIEHVALKLDDDSSPTATYGLHWKVARLTSILTHLRSEVYEPLVTHSQVHLRHDAGFASVFDAALLCTAGAGVGQQQKSGIDGGVIRKGWSSDQMAAQNKGSPIHGHS